MPEKFHKAIVRVVGVVTPNSEWVTVVVPQYNPDATVYVRVSDIPQDLIESVIGVLDVCFIANATTGVDFVYQMQFKDWELAPDVSGLTLDDFK